MAGVAMGPKGAKAFAEAIKGHPELTTLIVSPASDTRLPPLLCADPSQNTGPRPAA